jgi:cold shock CspA family protein
VAVYQNVTGVVKLCKPEGYGYIVPDSLIGAHDKDVFFHADALENTDWSKVQVGQKVRITSVVSNRKGLQANGVFFI